MGLRPNRLKLDTKKKKKKIVCYIWVTEVENAPYVQIYGPLSGLPTSGHDGLVCTQDV